MNVRQLYRRGLLRSSGSIIPPPPSIPTVQMPLLKTAYGAVLDGLSDAYVLVIGDSTDFARGAFPTGIGTAGARSKSITQKMVNELLARGYSQVSTDAWFGDGGVTSSPIGTEYSAYYTADGLLTGSVSIGSLWAAGANTLGGPLLSKTSATSSTITFTPALPCDEFVVLTADSNLSTITAKVDGSLVTTINGTASLNVVTTVVPAGTPGSPAAHTLTLDTTTATAASIIGVIARSSVNKRLIFINAGWRGATTTNFNDSSTAWRTKSMIGVLKPALTILSGGINDIVTGGGGPSTLTTYQTNISALIAAAAAWGDVALRTPNRIDPAVDVGPNVFMADLDAYLKTTAGSTKMLVDTTAIAGGFVPHNVSDPNSYFDDLHPQANFYAAVGVAEAAQLDANLLATPYTKIDIFGSPGPGTVGVPFSFTPQFAYGHGAKTLSLSGTALPSWASWNSTTGTISGTPDAAATTSGIIIGVSDSTGSDSITVSLVVQATLLDTFTGTSGSSLAGHSADTPSGITYSFNGTAAYTFDASGRIYNSAISTNQSNAISSYSAGQPNQWAELDITYVTVVSRQCYIALRAVDPLNFMGLGIRQSSNQLVIGKVVAGVFTQLAAVSLTPVAGTTYTVRAEAVGTLYSIYLNGAFQTSFNDSTFTAAGFIGVSTFSAAVSALATGAHLDNLKGGPL